jgi:4-amino-4-deoxy-L-arabinose transferase-like glycosyltransferase
MNIFLKKYRVEIFIFLLAFLVRAIYAVVVNKFFGEDVFVSFSDAAMYLRIAHNLVDYQTFSQATVTPFLMPDPMRTPLYPIFLAFFVCFKAPLLVIIFVQNALAGLMALMIYKLGVKIFKSQTVGIIAAVVFSLEPMSIYWSNLLMSDTLASFLFLSALYLFISKRYYLSAFAMGMAALTRPTYLYLFPIFLLMFAYEYRNQLFSRASWKVSGFVFWKKILIIIFVFFLCIFPWMLRNKIQFNNWELSSTGWFALYYFNAGEFASIKKEPYKFPPMLVDPEYHPDIPERKFTYYYEFYIAPYYKEYLFNLISKYPVDYFKFHFTSAIAGFQNHDYSYIMDHVLRAKIPEFPQSIGNILVVIGRGLWIGIYGLVILGFFVGDKRMCQFFLLSFYLANNFMIGYVSTTSAGGRYNLPFLPIILLLASYGGIYLFRYLFKLKNTVKKNYIKRNS